MAKESKVVQEKRLKRYSKYQARVYNRCTKCGRSGGYIRKFKLCRICFRKLAHEGEIPGVVKASW